MVTLALIIGIAWEFFEWTVGIIGDRRDTLMDLAMDVAGGALAAVVMRAVFGKRVTA